MGDEDPNNAKRKQVIPQQSHVSDDLITQEILTRLPINSILRFKSVSNQWYSTLSSSDFANAHLFRSPFSHPCAPVNTLFITTSHDCYLFSYDDNKSGNLEDNLVKLDIDFDIEKDHLKLIGCCNGLICLGNIFQHLGEAEKYFIIWNPATRKLHKHASYGHVKRFDTKNLVVIVAPGFGYASSVDDYKYVRILTVFWENDSPSNIVHIFSLRENKWREIDIGLELILPTRRAVLITEKLYWTATSSRYGKVVVSFDLGVERFEIIRFNSGLLHYLGVLGGRLSTWCPDGPANTDGARLMHILESPGVIVKSYEFPNELKLYKASQMIGFTKTGKFFVTGRFNNEARNSKTRMLGVVDTSAKPMQYTTLLSFNEMIEIASYVPSLVLPFSP